jgi:signal peptidase
MATQHTERAGTARRLSRWSVNLVVTVVIAACAAWLLPSLMGYSRYVITGGSMTGTYDKGSIVLEKPVPVSGLKVGDVITYLPPADSGVSNLVTHRILEMKPAAGGGTLFTTKGDANPKPDPWHFTLVSQEQPVVQLGVPHAGWVLIALADRNTRMLVVGAPAAVIALIALGQLVGAARGGRKKPTPEAPVAHA